MYPNWRLTARNGRSTLAHTAALWRSTKLIILPMRGSGARHLRRTYGLMATCHCALLAQASRRLSAHRSPVSAKSFFRPCRGSLPMTALLPLAAVPMTVRTSHQEAATVPIWALIILRPVMLHLSATAATAVIDRTGNGNQAGPYHAAAYQQQALLGGQSFVDRGGQLRRYGRALGAGDARARWCSRRAVPARRWARGTLAKQRHVIHGLLHHHIGQREPLLQEVNAPHTGRGRGRPVAAPAVVSRPSAQPRHESLHLLQNLAPAGMLGARIQLHSACFIRLIPAPMILGIQRQDRISG